MNETDPFLAHLRFAKHNGPLPEHAQFDEIADGCHRIESVT